MRLIKLEFPYQVHYLDPSKVARIKLDKPDKNSEDKYWVLEIWGEHVLHYSLWYETEEAAMLVMDQLLNCMNATIAQGGVSLK